MISSVQGGLALRRCRDTHKHTGIHVSKWQLADMLAYNFDFRLKFIAFILLFFYFASYRLPLTPTEATLTMSLLSPSRYYCRLLFTTAQQQAPFKANGATLC